MNVGALAEVIVALARRAGDVEAPVGFVFGVVTEEEPLEIELEQRLTLPEEMLILTDNVIGDAYLIEHFDEEGKPIEDDDPIYVVEHDLHKKDRVLLARVQGGQAYVILSRYYAVEKEEENKNKESKNKESKNSEGR